ncbi:MAG: hypothetical protein U1E08_04570 [Coriobacteriia bacterium]|nr:hypothetical protein [Actinomycetota bacterium]MDZ4166949.1 hypothetical protein [Coriobacteriia bacterium]
MSDGVLIGLVALALGVLVVVQIVSARAARQLGGRSANAVVMLRAINAAAVIVLLGWLVFSWLGR